jgi:hypothetical protein
MLHDQMSLDNSGFNVRAVPVTDALQQQKKLSLPTVEAWWLDVPWLRISLEAWTGRIFRRLA